MVDCHHASCRHPADIEAALQQRNCVTGIFAVKAVLNISLSPPCRCENPWGQQPETD